MAFLRKIVRRLEIIRQWIKIKVSHISCCKTISGNPALLKVALYTIAMHGIGSYGLMAKLLRNSIWRRDDSPRANNLLPPNAPAIALNTFKSRLRANTSRVCNP
ncbi:unnamed protein product [Ixodes pacificus]